MGVEIEHKYLVKKELWVPSTAGTLIRQGYLSIDKDRTVRVRVAAGKGFITVKGTTIGDSRAEYEYEIPVNDANEMLDSLCLAPIIEKTRYGEIHVGCYWEIDLFHGDNDGLIVAEIELASSKSRYHVPNWCGENVTTDHRYTNSALLKNPYKSW